MTVPSKFRLFLAGTALALSVSCSDESPRFPTEAEVELMYSSYSSTGGSSSSKQSSSSGLSSSSELSSSSLDVSSSSELSSSSSGLSSSSEQSSSSVALSSSSADISSSSVPSSSSVALSSSSSSSSSSSLAVSSSSEQSSSSVASSSSSAYLCKGTSYSPSNQLCDDRDGRIYKLVTIGNQTWMAKNLNYATTSSKCGGVSNSNTIEDDLWGTITYYPLENGETTNCLTYGRLYNWETAKNICPKGSHLPNSTEWKELIEEFTGNPTDLNNSGFAALPGGFGNSDIPGFVFAGFSGLWWSASEENDNDGWVVLIFYDNSTIDTILWGSTDKTFFLSVRCIIDPELEN